MNGANAAQTNNHRGKLSWFKRDHSRAALRVASSSSAGQAQFIAVLLRNQIAGSAESTGGRRTISYWEWSIARNAFERRDHVIVGWKALGRAVDTTVEQTFIGDETQLQSRRHGGNCNDE
jgi:hypothetical protein